MVRSIQIGLLVPWLGTLSGPALAAAHLASAPGGWDTASAQDEARTRARSWGDALGAEVIEVYAAPGQDDYQETLALLELPGALPADATPASALSSVLTPIGEGMSEPTQVATVPHGDDVPPVIRGRFEAEGTAYHVALASAHDARALLILSVRADEESLYERVFDESIEALRGLAAPLELFPRRAWGIGLVLGWMAFTIAAWLGVKMSSPSTPPLGRGRRVGAICVLASVLAAVIAWFALGSSTQILARVGLSREWLVAELSLLGLGAALTAWVVAAAMQARTRPVRSAPAGGAFAERNRPGSGPPGQPMPSTTPPAPDAGAPVHAIPIDHTEIAPGPPGPMQAPAGVPVQHLRIPGPLGGDVTQVAPVPAGLGSPSPAVPPIRTAPIVLRDAQGRQRAQPSPPPQPTGAPRAPIRTDRTLIGRGPPPEPRDRGRSRDDEGSGSSGGSFPPPM